MTKTQTALLLACFGGGDQSELIREIDSHWREVNQEKRGGDGGDKTEISCFIFNGISKPQMSEEQKKRAR